MLDDEFDPVDFCYLDSDPKYRLSRFERLTLTGGEELDRAVAWVARQLRRLIGDEFPNVDIEHIKAAAKFYGKLNWGDAPGEFFVPPTEAPSVSEALVHGFQDGEVLDLSFKSVYQPHFSGYAKEFLAYEENMTVHARYWRHHERGRPTIIAIHGWTMGDQRLNSLAFLPGLFYRMGMDVVLIELPFHGRRIPKQASEGEEFLFPSSDVVRTNECIGQIVSDLRQLGFYLRSREVKEFGCVGMSLGAYIGALWAGLDPLSFCVPMVPLVSLPEIAWKVLAGIEKFADLREKGLSREMLDEAYFVHSPLNFTPQLHKSRMLIIAGIGDKIVPPRQPKLLWQHWGMPQLQWMDGGHVAHFQKSKAFHEIVAFFDRLGYT